MLKNDPSTTQIFSGWGVVTMLSDEKLVTTRDEAQSVVWVATRDDVAADIAGLRAVEAAVRAATLREIAEQAGKTDSPANGLLDDVTDAAYRQGRADQIEKTVEAAWSIAQSQYNEGHTESSFGANLVREHFAAIRAQLNEGEDDE